MNKALRNGGILWLMFVFLVLETFISAFPMLAPKQPLLQGQSLKWMVWAAWGMLFFQGALSVWAGRRSAAWWQCPCAFSLTWVLALLPLSLGVLVVMLGAALRQGAALAWCSLLWAGVLVWQSIREAKKL